MIAHARMDDPTLLDYVEVCPSHFRHGGIGRDGRTCRAASVRPNFVTQKFARDAAVSVLTRRIER